MEAAGRRQRNQAQSKSLNTPGPGRRGGKVRKMKRRVFLQSAAVAAAYLPMRGVRAAVTTPPFELPKLNYSYTALEPHVDALTMEIHYSKHHKAYVDNLNKALASAPGAWSQWSLTDLLTRSKDLPESLRSAVRNQGGGHYNHCLYWDILTPGGPSKPSGALAHAIDKSFGSFENFGKEFTAGAMARFGSGWEWLVQNSAGEVKILSTANQDCPLSDGLTPLLGVDVWEHAYYLKYQNRRADYLAAIWKAVNWTAVGQRLRA